MSKRLLPEKQRSWLTTEIEVWLAQGILSGEQSQQILDLYEDPRQAGLRRSSLAMFTLRALAALLIGLAVLLLVGYNWSDMPAVVKLAILFGGVLASHLLGFYLRLRRGALLSSELAMFFGCLLYGVGIWQVAQIFHIQAHWPNGLWFWALGVLPFALCLDTVLMHALLAALLAIWAGSEVFGFGEMGLWFFGRWGFLPNGAYTLPLIALPCLIWAYRKQSVVTVALYLVALCWWAVLQPFAWHAHTSPVFFIGAVGGLLMVIAELHLPRSPFAVPYRGLGVLLAGGALVPLGFHDFHREVYYGSTFSLLHSTGLTATLAVAIATAALFFLASARSHRQAGGDFQTGNWIGEYLRRQWLPLTVVAVMAGLSAWAAFSLAVDPGPRWGHRASPGLTTVGSTIVANVVMLGLAVWLMGVGLREDRGQPFTAGILYFLAWTVMRYIDLFGEFGGMPGAALMFFLCGAALFGVAWYWRHRKEISHV